jgi:hypothetical protein
MRQAPNSSLERSGHDKVRTSRPCAARAQLVRYALSTTVRVALNVLPHFRVN